MIKIDNNYIMEFRNGYFITHQQAIRSVLSRNAGKQYTCDTKTYPNLICAYDALTLKGVNGTKLLLVGEQLIKNGQIKQGKDMAAARAKKEVI
jgi:hypothetical protein